VTSDSSLAAVTVWRLVSKGGSFEDSTTSGTIGLIRSVRNVIYHKPGEAEDDKAEQ
jgi:hypothetical protein